MFDDQQTDQNNTDNFGSTPTMGLGVNPVSTTPEPTETPTVVLPNDQTPTIQPAQPAAQPSIDMPTATASPASLSSLEEIKKKAIEELSPLVNKLDQTPEEKYKTLLMLIQATDDESLVSEAYASAHTITDEKTRAEALLNIVNEINYLSQKNK